VPKGHGALGWRQKALEYGCDFMFAGFFSGFIAKEHLSITRSNSWQVDLGHRRKKKKKKKKKKEMMTKRRWL